MDLKNQNHLKFNYLHYKTNHPMLKYLPFQTLSLIYLLTYFLAQPLYHPSNIQSQNRMLYSSSTTYLTPTTFNITFSQSLGKLPIVSYGLNNYHMGDRFYYQNIQTVIGQVELSYFVLQVIPIQSTYIYKLSICYVAIDDQINFASFSKSYPNPSIVSQQNGNRTTTIYQPYYPNIPSNIALFITGFYLQSINQFYIHTLIGTIFTYGFQFHISTLSDCTVHRLDLSFLFYPNHNNNTYYISDHHSYCHQNITTNTISTLFTRTDGVLLFGISGFGGQTYDSIIHFGWNNIINRNNTLTVTINTTNLTFLCYNYVQIFSLIPPTLNAQQNSNPLIKLIIYAISSLLGLLISMLSIRCFCNSKYLQRRRLQESKKKLSVMTLNQLPSLHF